jgi:7,8-dihydro-6-hydroxymethylpterin-pyrophosphokinase
MNATVFLLLGTNMGDRNSNLSDAIRAITQLGKIKKSPYSTAAWGLGIRF